jgi:hypothetical protein
MKCANVWANQWSEERKVALANHIIHNDGHQLLIPQVLALHTQFSKCMQLLSAQQIQELDAYTCANEPITSINLMERAAEALCEEIGVREGYLNLTIICGKGNNGGDGLALARLISKKGNTCSGYCN